MVQQTEVISETTEKPAYEKDCNSINGFFSCFGLLLSKPIIKIIFMKEKEHVQKLFHGISRKNLDS